MTPDGVNKERQDMLGIDDKFVWLAYVLCVGSTVLCVVYAYINWNTGDDKIEEADLKWEVEEEKVERDL
jgi:hypothetical protein